MIRWAILTAVLLGCHVSSAKSLWSNRDWSPRSGMVITNGLVVFVGKNTSATSELVALGLTDGTVRWTAALDRSGDAGMAMAATDDAIYVADDQTVECFEFDGKKRWLQRAVAPGTVDGIYTLTPPVVAGKLILFGGKLWSRVMAIDAATGAVVWRTVADGHDQPQALVVRGDTVISFGYDDVVASNLSDGKQRWREALGASLGPAMVPLRDSVRLAPDLGGAVLAVDDNALVSLSIATGAENWRHKGGGALSFAGTSAAVVVADGNTTTGLDPGTGAVRWSYADGGRVVAPIDARTALVVGHDAHAVAWSDGSARGSAPTKAGLDLRVLSARDGRAVFGDATHATLATLDGGKLTLADASDHALPGSDPRFAASQAIEAASDGSLLVLRYASGTIAVVR
jgi:outer membrane protein assembly factor BamB